jgi:hypothetical protein
MYKKINELIIDRELELLPNDNLKTISEKIFPYSVSSDFIMSDQTPEERYNISVNKSSLSALNNEVNNFELLGPNEKYLVNHIFYSPDPLMYLVGGIGVGKTQFCHLLMDRVLTEIKHQKEADSSYCPFIIYYNFNDFEKIYDSNNPELIRKKVLDAINNRIISRIYEKKFFDIQKEVTDVWEEILEYYSNRHNKNDAIDYLIKQLEIKKAGRGQLKKSRIKTTRLRRSIRNDIEKDSRLFRTYLSLLLGYIKRRFFQNHEKCMILVIDNVDQDISIVQKIVKQNVYKIARISKIRVLVTLRQTTYYQQVNHNHNLQEIPNAVAYCGPHPLSVIENRLLQALTDDVEFGIEIAENEMRSLKNGIRIVNGFVSSDKRLRYFFNNLCGHSIRKGILVGRNLINNSAYDILNLNRDELSQFIIQRALITGKHRNYTWSADNIVENIFQVHQNPVLSYFIKIRILKAIKNTNINCIHLSALLDILEAFGYPLELICNAINELKNREKRLIWSDSVHDSFECMDSLLNHGSSTLSLTTIGNGYEEQMFKSFTYIREIMKDVVVEVSNYGSEWEEEKLTDRISNLMRFIYILIDIDIKETKKFISDMGVELYFKVCGGKNLISSEIAISIDKAVGRILNFNINKEEGKIKENLEEYSKQYEKFYKERLTWLEHNEKMLF